MGNLDMSQTSIDDHRKFAVWVILAPYLVDVNHICKVCNETKVEVSE
jgi:hypothetical protein